MGTTGKQSTTTPPQRQAGKVTQTLSSKSGVPANATPLRNDLLAASSIYVKQAVDEKRSYLKAAVANPYNLSLFLGGLAASVLTLNPLLAVIVVCMEILWAVNAPGSK